MWELYTGQIYLTSNNKLLGQYISCIAIKPKVKIMVITVP